MPHICGCLKRPGEDAGFCVAGVTGGYELPDMVLSTGPLEEREAL